MMDQGFRRGFTAAEKTELWDRWQRGESLKAIGRAFDNPRASNWIGTSLAKKHPDRTDKVCAKNYTIAEGDGPWGIERA
jgi:hypothetical protein